VRESYITVRPHKQGLTQPLPTSRLRLTGPLRLEAGLPVRGLGTGA